MLNNFELFHKLFKISLVAEDTGKFFGRFWSKIIQEISGSTFDQPSGAGWGLAGKLILRIHIPPYYSPSLG